MTTSMETLGNDAGPAFTGGIAFRTTSAGTSARRPETAWQRRVDSSATSRRGPEAMELPTQKGLDLN